MFRIRRLLHWDRRHSLRLPTLMATFVPMLPVSSLNCIVPSLRLTGFNCSSQHLGGNRFALSPRRAVCSSKPGTGNAIVLAFGLLLWVICVLSVCCWECV